MELKDYQTRTLDVFERWQNELMAAQTRSAVAVAALEQVGADIPPDIRNYPKTAWQQLAQAGVLLKPPENTSAAPTTLAGRSRTFALKCQPAAAKRYWRRRP